MHGGLWERLQPRLRIAAEKHCYGSIMYNLKRLGSIAQEGLADLLPAMRQAFNADPTDDRLDLVYGRRPFAKILMLSVAGIVGGWILEGILSDFVISEHVNWSAVVVGLLFAGVLRRYLFRTEHARADDFPWLAASLMPAIGLLMVVAAVSEIFLAGSRPGEPGPAGIVLGTVLVIFTDALGVAAAVTIAVAALCFRRDWPRALWDLAMRLLVFKVMVFITAIILLEVGVFGAIFAVLLEVLFGISIPAWLSELADQLSYAGLLSIAYLAIIGATWTVCRESFGELLETGQVNVLETIAELAKDPKRKQKHEERKRRRAEKREKKLEKRKGRGTR